MKIEYYSKAAESANVIAHVGVEIPQWHMTINNIAILRSKKGGWYLALPTFKNKETDEWDRVIHLETDAHTRFLASLRQAIEVYAKEKGEDVS